MEKPEIIVTEDGSHSLKVSTLNEHYHSTFGAISESQHVFIEAGFQQLMKRKITLVRILEVGMGTGLNVLLTLMESYKNKQEVHYTAVESFPLAEEIWRNLNYPELFGDQLAGEWFDMIHVSEWDGEEKLTPGFILRKLKMRLQDLTVEKDKYDLIYFDAFGPDIQPEMWTEEIFNNIAGMTAPDGLLVTYSAKGSVRRAMQKAGFKVERIPGPKGKREMIRGMRYGVRV